MPRKFKGPPLAPGERCAADCQNCKRPRSPRCKSLRAAKWNRENQRRHREADAASKRRARWNRFARRKLGAQQAAALDLSIVTKRQLQSPKYILELHGRRHIELWVHEEPTND